MTKLARLIAGVVVALIITGIAGPLLNVSKVTAQDANWLSGADPVLSKMVDLPSNTLPVRANVDCTKLNYHNTVGNDATGCFTDSEAGTMDVNGAAILMKDSALGIPITSTVPGQYGITPIANQSLVLSQTSAPIIGSYLHFYTNFKSNLSLHEDARRNIWYSIEHPPGIDLVDSKGQPIVTNAYGTLSFSSNGDWMVVDSPNNAFLRVNLTTFTTLRYALSMNSGLDYSPQNARTAISDDGRYIAMASYKYHFLRVYDLLNCPGLTPNNTGGQIECPSRDYWPYVSSHLNGFFNIWSVRFTNDDNLNFDATYNYVANEKYDSARFVMTAPGGQLHKIDYLTLGDSYISGQGTFQYKQGTDTDNNTCHVSTLAYPYIIGASLENSYESVACSGAKTDDITDDSDKYIGQVKDKVEAKDRDITTILDNFMSGYLNQLSFVRKYMPRVITLSIGGNDIGFSDIMKACVAPQAGDQTCYDSYTERLSLAESITALFSTLQQTYSSILAADPGVQLYVVGYPQVATLGNCATNVHLNSTEITFSQQLITYLDTITQRAAGSVGARYVDMQNALAGHRLCEAKTSDVAINGVTAGNDGGPLGLKIFGAESFHPNVFGHQLLAQKVLQATNNFKQPMPAADSSITALPITDPSAQVLLSNYQSDGMQLDSAIYDDDMPGFALQGGSTQLSVTSLEGNLVIGGSYTVVLHSSPTNLGTLIADGSGDLNGQVTIPPTTPPGFHTLHIYGQDAAGRQIDIYKVIYVAASADDYNGDGTPNSNDQCLVVPLSGQDVDEDGIDDACDPDISEPPDYGHKYPATAALVGNMVLVVNPAN